MWTSSKHIELVNHQKNPMVRDLFTVPKMWLHLPFVLQLQPTILRRGQLDAWGPSSWRPRFSRLLLVVI